MRMLKLSVPLLVMCTSVSLPPSFFAAWSAGVMIITHEPGVLLGSNQSGVISLKLM